MSVVVRLPDGSQKEFPLGSTPLDVAKSIGTRLAREAVAAKIDGQLVDLSCPIEKDADVSIVTMDSPEGLEILRHSAAHLMAHALQRLFPGIHLAIGPVVENRFYYDVQSTRSITSDDFAAIEAEMAKIAKEDLPIERIEVSREEAAELFAGSRLSSRSSKSWKTTNPSRCTNRVISWTCAEARTCRVRGRIKAFKLLSVAGAYWRGDAQGIMLQRIYGTAWPQKSSWTPISINWKSRLSGIIANWGASSICFHSKKRRPDSFSGIPGMDTLPTLGGFLQTVAGGQRLSRGVHAVDSALNLVAALRTLGSLQEDMFVIDNEEEPMSCKPMNCPAHCLLYKSAPRSYRDLPIKLSEYGPLSRFEASGTLHGALRVRGFHQDDAHLFCLARTRSLRRSRTSWSWST